MIIDCWIGGFHNRPPFAPTCARITAFQHHHYTQKLRYTVSKCLYDLADKALNETCPGLGHVAVMRREDMTVKEIAR